MALSLSALGFIVAGAILATMTGANAQVVRHPSAFHRGLLLTPVQPIRPAGVAHTIFGSIAKMTTRKSFLLRLRSGRVLPVDATAAMASGRYSAPLYIGKQVVVGGALDARGLFVAQRVTRMTQIDRTTPEDR
jgi:hypothetical protein